MKTLLWVERSFTFGLPKWTFPLHLERLDGTIARLYFKVQDVRESVLNEQYEGKWSVKQNIGHLAEIDVICGRRINELRTGVETLSPTIMQQQADYNSQSIRDVLELFALNRKTNIRRYESLTDSELDHQSTHARLKQKMSAVDLAWFDAEHDDHHLFRINEIIKALT